MARWYLWSQNVGVRIVCVHSCEQEILEAEARGKNIRCTSEVARKSGGHKLRNWQEDVTAMYCPPKPHDARSQATYAEMAQKDVPGHAEEKHALHHDGLQQPDGPHQE